MLKWFGGMAAVALAGFWAFAWLFSTGTPIRPTSLVLDQLTVTVEKTKEELMATPPDHLFDVTGLFARLPKSMVSDGQIRHRFRVIFIRTAREGGGGHSFEAPLRDVPSRTCARILAGDQGRSVVAAGVATTKLKEDLPFGLDDADLICSAERNDVVLRYR